MVSNVLNLLRPVSDNLSVVRSFTVLNQRHLSLSMLSGGGIGL